MTVPFSFKFVGHAGFLLSSGKTSLLCDPWLSQEGAFLSTWHQFPPNDFIKPESLHHADYIYISHNHFDHFDKKFLKDFPKDKVTLIIADFISDTFYRELAELGFPRIIKLKDWEKYSLDGSGSITVTMFKDQSLYKIDSLLLIDVAGTKILNKNDCHLSEKDFPKFKEQGIDILLAQFSGAMWYPAAYAYDEKTKKAFSKRIKMNLLSRFVNLANGVGAKQVIHNAGPPCFLEDDFFRLNFQEEGIFHDQQDVFEEVAKKISGKLHLLLPGDEFTFKDQELQFTQKQHFDFSRKEQFLQEYKHKRKDLIKQYLDKLSEGNEHLLKEFSEHIKELFSSSPVIRDKINSLVLFTIAGRYGGKAYVDTRNAGFSISDTSPDTPNYEIMLDAKIANLLAKKEHIWEDIFLSLRFKAARNPDNYNWPLFALLRFGQEKKQIAEIERQFKENELEKITVYDKDKTYTIQRYCPHAGEDLSNAKIKDGILVCPRHHWTFDLEKKGKCIFGGNIPLCMVDQEAKNQDR